MAIDMEKLYHQPAEAQETSLNSLRIKVTKGVHGNVRFAITKDGILRPIYSGDQKLRRLLNHYSECCHQLMRFIIRAASQLKIQN